MRRIKPLGMLLLAGVALWLAACSGDSGGGSGCGSAAALSIGQSSDETVAAGECNAYEFTPDDDGDHYIYITAISSGDYNLLEFDADNWLCSGLQDELNCAILVNIGDNTFANDLTAGDTYDFTLTDLSGENTTLTVIVTFGPL